MNKIKIDDLDATVAPAGIAGSAIIEVVFIIIFLSSSPVVAAP